MTASNRTPTSPRGVERVTVALYLPVDLVRNLRRVAAAEDRSVSSFVTRALADLRDPAAGEQAETTEPTPAV